jgi:hypothetical protein
VQSGGDLWARAQIPANMIQRADSSLANEHEVTPEAVREMMDLGASLDVKALSRTALAAPRLCHG